MPAPRPAVFAILAASFCAPAQQPLRLAEALREALANHPLLAAADGRVGTAQGLLEQAALRPNPTLTFQVEGLRAWQRPYRPFIENDQFVYLSQTLETARKRERRTELAGANKALAAIARDVLAQAVTAQVRDAYWVAVGASRMAAVYQETLQNFGQTVEYHEIRVREGNMAEADLIRVRLELERLRLAASGANLTAERAVIALQREMGRTAIAGTVRLAETLEGESPLPAEDEEAALNRRAEVRLARQGVNASMANEKLQVALARPDVDLSGGYKRAGGYDGVLAYLSVDLPWRNRNQGNIAAAGAETSVARSSTAAAEATVRAEVRAAYAAHRVRREQVTGMLQLLAQNAAETARIAQAAYREGGADLLRLLDAERVRLETDLLRVQALTEFRLSESAVQTAMGVTP